MSDIENLLNIIYTPEETIGQSDKRDYLKSLVNQGKASSLGGKTPWTIDRIDKASDKVINKLYKKMNNSQNMAKKRFNIEKNSGVDDVENMMSDINSNFLIKNTASEMMGKLTPTININQPSTMEVFGSHVYERYGIYLAPVSLFCTIFNHLDWETFSQISEERKKSENDNFSELSDLINE